MRVVLVGWVAVQLVARGSLLAQASGLPVLRGRVIDARTASPLSDVSVVITSGPDTVARARSDSSGSFQTPARVGSLVAHFMRVGYRQDSLSTSVGEFPLRVAMTPVGTIANTLAAVVVKDSSPRTAFERRAGRNSGGTFIRAEDIAKRKPVRTSELFRSLPGVRIDDSSGVTQLVSIRGTRQTAPTSDRLVVGGETVHIPSGNARPCVLRIGTEGHLMPPDFSVDEIRPEEILGVEVYLGAATIPAEFSSVQHDAPCGIVMFWMKRGGRP